MGNVIDWRNGFGLYDIACESKVAQAWPCVRLSASTTFSMWKDDCKSARWSLQM